MRDGAVRCGRASPGACGGGQGGRAAAEDLRDPEAGRRRLLRRRWEEALPGEGCPGGLGAKGRQPETATLWRYSPGYGAHNTHIPLTNAMNAICPALSARAGACSKARAAPAARLAARSPPQLGASRPAMRACATRRAMTIRAGNGGPGPSAEDKSDFSRAKQLVVHKQNPHPVHPPPSSYEVCFRTPRGWLCLRFALNFPPTRVLPLLT